MSPLDSPTVTYDVAVIGAGVVGCAVARLLSERSVSVVIVEASSDVGTGTSKANTAILHTGFDAVPGSTESRLVARGHELLTAYASKTGIAIEPLGGLLVAWDDEQLAQLPALAAKAGANGYGDASIVDSDGLYDLEPNLGRGALGALWVPGEHIIDPWSPVVAFATEAVANGAILLRHAAVSTVSSTDQGHELTTTGGLVRARFVVNAAGLHSDDVHRSFGHESFRVTARRGELIVFDKSARPLVSHVLLPVPTATTKGVLVSPTVFGNVLLGPTADDIDDKSATGSTRAGIDGLLDKGRRLVPGLVDHEVTAVYAGLRAATEHRDYCIEMHADQRYLCLGGIRSTGLTSAMAVAEEALRLLTDAGLDAPLRDPDDLASIEMVSLAEAGPRPWQRGGTIVCHCERVTADEIVAACRGPVAAVDLDGVRRRTRALTGRCQGFNCLADVTALTSQGTGRSMGQLLRVSEEP